MAAVQAAAAATALVELLDDGVAAVDRVLQEGSAW